MILLLDSTFLIDVLRKQDTSLALLGRAISARRQLRTSVINVAEVFAGMREHESDRTTNLLSKIPSYDVSSTIAKRAGILKNMLARKGRTCDLDDMIVAATCLEYDVKLVTSNRKDFKNTGVVFYEEDEK